MDVYFDNAHGFVGIDIFDRLIMSRPTTCQSIIETDRVPPPPFVVKISSLNNTNTSQNNIFIWKVADYFDIYKIDQRDTKLQFVIRVQMGFYRDGGS